MNTGIIASRYAAALLRLVDETGGGETVVRQVLALSEALSGVPELRRVVDDPKSVSPDRKIALFEAALSLEREELAPEIRKLIALLIRNGRICDTALVFRSFVGEYDRSRGLVRGLLTVPSPADADALSARLEALVASRTGKKLILSTRVDESLIGGFVFEYDDQLLDASVARQLDLIRGALERRNRRIV